jgi:hypothetical protein
VHFAFSLNSYAEETADISTTVPPGCTLGGLAYTYPPRWDTWGRFIQPLMSVIPTLTVTDAQSKGGG